MTFLNPLVLIGLITAAIPLILHLLNLRKLRTIEFSTLAFLKELQQTKIRRLKLRQLLLLIIRTLLIIMIVLAFARPALRGSILGSIGSHARSTIVLILDDSFSMMAHDRNGERFKQAKEATRKIIDLLKDGDEAFLIKLSDIPRATIDPATHDFHSLRNIINEAQVTSIRRTIEEALKLSARLLQQSKNANKEVYLVSDLQQTLFSHRSDGDQWTLLSLFDMNTKFFIIEIGSEIVDNVGIDSVAVLSTILEKDKPATVSVSLRNFSDTRIQDYVVSAFLQNNRVAQSNVHIEPWGSASVVFSITPKQSGHIRSSIELENDAIEHDNKRYFSLYLPELINLLTLSASKTDLQFINLALATNTAETTHTLLKVQHTTPQNFSLVDLRKFDVIVSTNIFSLSTNDVERIKKFINDGGSIILFPEEDIQPDGSNASLLSTLGIPAIQNIIRASPQGAGITFQKIDFDHPLFSTMFETEQQKEPRKERFIESPTILKLLQRTSGKQARTIITLTDGMPFLTEHSFGNGKILFFSVAPTLSWSDFPLKGLFAPLLYRSILHLTSQGESQAAAYAGDQPLIKVRSSTSYQGQNKFRLISPDNSEELLLPNQIVTKNTGSSRWISVPTTLLTTLGYYEIRNDTSMIQLISVNPDPLESDLRKITSEGMEKFWKQMNIDNSSIQFIKADDHLQPAILQSRFGIELWKHCIGLALMLALLEMLIARDSRKATHMESTG
ncbi:MAG TPA: BatA domain-containing protein [Bacteroidota bacterium]|nr:BatA domain-containing protein [Bacteroidota bacterium]